MSLVEAKANAILGLILSWLFTFYGLPLFGIEVTLDQATWVTFSYFFISILRSYIIRRVFNNIGKLR